MLNKSKITTSIALIVIASAGLAQAAPEKKDTDKDLLRGPNVTQTTKNNSNQSDSMSDKRERNNQGDRARNQHQTGPANLQEFQNALRQLMSEKSEQQLDLSAEQRTDIKEIVVAQREAMKVFREEHKEEIEQIRAEIKAEVAAMQAERKAQNKDAMSEQKPKERKQTVGQEKLRTLMESSPANGQALEQIKAVLSAEQLTTVQTHITNVRAKRANAEGNRPLRNAEGRPQREGQMDDSERPRGPQARKKRMDAKNDNVSSSGKRERKSKQEKTNTEDD
tara:strand:- start:443330 stop:444166 length:837 start_codon:yes stop_codon:yes gene_type:complete